MKTIFITLTAVLITVSITAQVPQKMSYQAIIRNSSDSLIRNQAVGLRISILQGSADGTEVYKEVYDPKPVTNMNGLLTVEIGTGTPLTGTFSGINWSDSSYFVKTEIAPSGNTNYTIITTSQLLSVPYAFHAKTAESISGTGMDALLARIDVIEKRLNILQDSIFTDTRDGISYKMVRIGNQIWIAENLKYLPEVSGIPEKLSAEKPFYYVLDYNGNDVSEAKATENYNKYGVLYNWPAATNNALAESNTNPSGIQGVCPAGWHLPSMNEWKQLIDNLGGEVVAAKKLMATGSEQWKDNTVATNESGFTALPGGALVNAWGLGFTHDDALWWTSTFWYSINENGNPKSYSHPAISGFNSKFSLSGIYDWDDMYGSGLSVRCVKD